MTVGDTVLGDGSGPKSRSRRLDGAEEEVEDEAGIARAAAEDRKGVDEGIVAGCEKPVLNPSNRMNGSGEAGRSF